MEKVGERYEKIIQLRIDRIMSVVPLIIIAALGLMVLLIAWSMLSGIFAGDARPARPGPSLEPSESRARQSSGPDYVVAGFARSPH